MCVLFFLYFQQPAHMYICYSIILYSLYIMPLDTVGIFVNTLQYNSLLMDAMTLLLLICGTYTHNTLLMTLVLAHPSQCAAHMSTNTIPLPATSTPIFMDCLPIAAPHYANFVGTVPIFVGSVYNLLTAVCHLSLCLTLTVRQSIYTKLSLRQQSHSLYILYIIAVITIIIIIVIIMSILIVINMQTIIIIIIFAVIIIIISPVVAVRK